MAIYKFFPTKTATIYSYYPNKNTGLDEITDLSLYNSIEGTYESSRTLVQFDQDEIANLFNENNIPISGNFGQDSTEWKAYLKLYLANASEIPLDYSIHCAPISGTWNMGTGRLANIPETTDGVSWKWRDYLSGSQWTYATNSFFQIIPNGVLISTCSIESNINGIGGNWYTYYEDPSIVPWYLHTTQSFNHSDSKDIELNISRQLKYWLLNYMPNQGSIIKHNIEFTSSSFFETKYFTSNTHTIYPPCLEVRWDDSYYSSSLSTISNSNIVANLINKGEYQQDSIQRFRINVRDKYPTRNFQTSSVYLNNKILPTASYWSLKDYDTDEIIIDYDTTFTKISANDTGNYFDIYMNGLEPERYYKVLVKTNINNEILVIDNDNIFKVVK